MREAIDVLKTAKTIAVVGISNKPDKPSNFVADFMKKHGYTIIPVNPNYDTVLGEKCYPDLRSVPQKIDIVNVFRRPEDILPVAMEAKDLNIKCFWMQAGIRNEVARLLLAEKGVVVVEDT